MTKSILSYLLIILNLNLGYSQVKSEINSLLNEISEIDNSKETITTEQAKKIISFGEDSLIILADFFTDDTVTNVTSECQGRKLTKGEIAIIMADRIEGMPYFTITGIQNCTLTFCDKNPNLIEYYLSDNQKDGGEKFKEDYLAWLKSDRRIEWIPLIENKSKKERKKEIRKRKRDRKKMEFKTTS